MRDRLTANSAMPIVTWGGLLIGIPGLIGLIVVSIIGREWAALASVAFGLIVTLGVIWHLSRRHRAAQISKTKIFRPFALLTAEQTWPRGDVEGLLATIRKPGDNLPLVVGASGVGKSTLLNVVLRARIKRDHPEMSYSVLSENYPTLIERLRELLSAGDDGQQKVVVVDQFEQWLAFIGPKSNQERAADHSAMADILREAQQRQDLTIILSLRREWYFELGFLGALVSSPSEVCEVQAPALGDASDPMLAGIRRSFIEMLGDGESEVTDAILERLSPAGRLSPLQAQIVGAVLERKVDVGIDIDADYFDHHLGGVPGVRDAYFREVLDGSDRPDLCMKILFALSVKTRHRREAKVSTLVRTLYESPAAIKTALEYLVSQGVVTKASAATYALAHDFLAEYFNAKSGLELNPVDRDNIQIYAAAHGDHSPAVNPRKGDDVRRRLPFGMSVVGGLLILMTARFFYFGIDTTLVGPSVAKPLIGPLFDASYLLILVPDAVWICYCGLFYDRLFVHLNETKPQRALSIFVILNLIISVLLGIFIPVAWMLGVASGGLVFASRMLWLSRNPEISRSAQKRLRRFALPTFGNLIIVAVLGALGTVLSVEYVKTGTNVNTWVWINLAASVMITYSCLAIAPLHVSRSGVSQLLGLIGRPGSVSTNYLDN